MFRTIPLFFVLRDQGIQEREIPNYVATKVGYLSNKFVKQVLFMGKPMSLDLKQRWAEALGLDLVIAFPEEKQRLRYIPPLQVDEDHAQLAARVLSITAHFRAIIGQLEADEAAKIVLGETTNDVGLLSWFMSELISVKQVIADVERILRDLGVDVDACYRRIKSH